MSKKIGVVCVCVRVWDKSGDGYMKGRKQGLCVRARVVAHTEVHTHTGEKKRVKSKTVVCAFDKSNCGDTSSITQQQRR